MFSQVTSSVDEIGTNNNFIILIIVQLHLAEYKFSMILVL